VEIQIRYSDFQVIKNRGRFFNIDQYNNLHDRCITFLTNELKPEKKGPVIVASHHMPPFINYPEEYLGDPLNEAFATELSELILSTQPAYWIFGHHHSNKRDFTIGKTRLVTNQLGYVCYNEQDGFDEGKIIVI
jgi:Icc-related predicted phosphoesterase